MTDVPTPTEALVAAAKDYPGGWVYEIVGDFDDAEVIPPEAIRGAWRVSGEGLIVGDFIPNPSFAVSVKLSGK